MKNISTHITSALAGVTAFIALAHPGFHIPPFVQGLTVTLSTAVATILQYRHLSFKQALAQAENYAKLQTTLVQAQATTPAPQGAQGAQA